MAEPHDRAGGGAADAAAARPAAFPAPPPELAAPAEQAYRPLSVLALIGFGLAALYAAVAVLLGLVAFLSGRPLLMGGWTLLFPLVAAALCLVARAQVRRS